MQFAIDTGGTFTDLIVKGDDGISHMFKVPTTPADTIVGVLAVLDAAAKAFGMSRSDLLARGSLLVHGTTHAINAVITKRTARTALLVTQGHPDILVLREGGRAEPFNFRYPYPEPYIPKSLTFEVPERVRPDGSVLMNLDEQAVIDIAAKLKAQRIEAVAVCLLWSIANGEHEDRIGWLLEQHLPGIPVTLSHRLNPVIREFRRASSAAIDASLKPMMARYLLSLEGRLREAGFAGRVLVVTSQAGVIDAKDAAAAPIHIVNSGPSMAPIAGRYYAQRDECSDTAIVADTGGTTYDVSLVRRGRIPTSRETWIGPPYRGIMLGFPWVDVKSVGAGGGSIAWVDTGGLLHVGPRSAGADPGPVAYGRGGTEPTVTDAALALGYLDASYFLGGAMHLDRERAEAAILEKVATPLGIDAAHAADAIMAVATENMIQAIVDITVNQGIDPRESVLIGGGGAAGLNAVRIARRLGCTTVLIPEVGAALSAAGAIMSELKNEYRSGQFATTADFDHSAAASTLSGLERQCRAFIDGPGAGALESAISYKVDARYATQVWEIEVPLHLGRIANSVELSAFVADFHKTHEDVFAFADPQSPIEIIGWSAQVTCRFNETDGLRLAPNTETPIDQHSRRAHFASLGWVDTPVRQFSAVDVGELLTGPVIVESSFTTVVVDPGAVATRRPSGSLSITLESLR
ncbi:MAG: hydantoinase/oxoprolinase family protein [Burkholderiaceae bacterium]|nr:hydantoinase/oxoprolinase family protein [Burkholderiaceae bacterium]